MCVFQLGDCVGRGRLHSNSAEQEESLWHRQPRRLPDTVKLTWEVIQWDSRGQVFIYNIDCAAENCRRLLVYHMRQGWWEGNNSACYLFTIFWVLYITAYCKYCCFNCLLSILLLFFFFKYSVFCWTLKKRACSYQNKGWWTTINIFWKFLMMWKEWVAF